MNLSNLFGALRRREVSKRATAKARYLELVARAVDGKAADEDEAAEVLDGAGRSVEEFERDVRTAANRNELRARIERANAARPKLKRLEERAKQIEDDFRAAQVRFQAAVDALREEARPLEAVVALAAGAEGELINSCPREDLLAAFADVSRAYAEMNGVVHRLRETLLETQVHHDGLRLARKAEEKIEVERRAQQNGWEERIRGLQEIVADPEQHLRSQRQPPLDDAVARLARLEQRKAALEKQILEA